MGATQLLNGRGWGAWPLYVDEGEVHLHVIHMAGHPMKTYLIVLVDQWALGLGGWGGGERTPQVRTLKLANLLFKCILQKVEVALALLKLDF